MLQSLNDWSLALRNGHSSRVVYIDFSKAFDSVSHPKLLHKLSKLGFNDNLYSVLCSYLSGRSQQVMIDNSYSNYVSISSGVPQGSVLGPLLILIYINDLVDFLPSSVLKKLFADDLKLYSEIRHNADGLDLNICLSKLDEWSRLWQLSIAFPKCYFMDISLSKRLFTDHIPILNNTDLSRVTETRDLGVNFNEKLSFSDHISGIVSSAKQRMALLLRSFLFKDPHHLMIGFKSFILPIVEY